MFGVCERNSGPDDFSRLAPSDWWSCERKTSELSFTLFSSQLGYFGLGPSLCTQAWFSVNGLNERCRFLAPFTLLWKKQITFHIWFHADVYLSIQLTSSPILLYSSMFFFIMYSKIKITLLYINFCSNSITL